MQEEWFSEWFNTPYYHILYKDRDDKEAEFFIDRLVQHLNPDPNTLFLDLACGKGRHATYLNSLGYIVDGCDLAEASILEAKKKENSNLNFFIQDMRLPTEKKYDCILNLFTSIGYFEDFEDNSKTFASISKSLNENGIFVIDFLNAAKVKEEMVGYQEKEIEGLLFKISKKVEDRNIVKTIEFEADARNHHYEEKVTLLEKSDFIHFANQSNLKLIAELGDYELNPLSDKSDRLILIFQKA